MTQLVSELTELRRQISELSSRIASDMQAATPAANLPGRMTATEERGYFSPAEVRAMNPRELHENYARIFESMRHWQ